MNATENLQPMEVLLVEDDQDDAFLVQEMLSEVESSNFQLTCVEDLAEGVETEDELAFLRVRHAMMGQGNLFSYPLPAHSIEECLKTGPLLQNSDLH